MACYDDADNVRKLLWGQSRNGELFNRWNQGLDAERLLIEAFSKILLQASTDDHTVLVLPVNHQPTDEVSEVDTLVNQAAASDGSANQQATGSNDDERTQAKKLKQDLDHAKTSKSLLCDRCTSARALRESLERNIAHFKAEGGVLHFLHSLIMTKGLDHLRSELEDDAEPLIDSTHGHGSQALVNMLLTGRAVSQLFDGSMDLGGLKLMGIGAQPRVGFLSQMEALRYLEVGSLLKTPELPIWLLASETHITVLFSMERSLVSTDSVRAHARRAFASRDPEGSGFIAKDALGDLLQELDLCAESEYVAFMQADLDSDELGIILLHDFLRKFYPEDEEGCVLREATFYFCNSLRRSNANNEVRFQQLSALMPEFTDMDVAADHSPIQQCLATRWPTIQLSWSGQDPSLN